MSPFHLISQITISSLAAPGNHFSALLCLIFAALAGYFAFRCLALKRALREMAQDLKEIEPHIAQNRILRLPLPDRDLERVMESLNDILEEVRRQRLIYETREKEFKKQMEDISHDLRTPLTVILGYLKWMGRDMASDASQRESLAVLEQNARAMERLVSQFYTFSQLSARDYTPEMLDVDICRILRESLAEHWQILEQANLRLDSLLPEHPVIIRGNADALARIFSNLFQNAGRYACSYLRIRMEETGKGQIRVYFCNDSDQLTEDAIPHLFDRFYKIDPARNQKGSGLGLTIAKSLAELMGGTLEAQTVPARAGQAADDVPPARGLPFYATPREGQGIHICFRLAFPLSQPSPPYP